MLRHYQQTVYHFAISSIICHVHQPGWDLLCHFKSCILELNLHLNCANSTTLNCTVWHEYTMRRWVDKKASKKEKFMIPWRSAKAVKQDVFLPPASHFCSTKYQHCIKRSERQLQFRLDFSSPPLHWWSKFINKNKHTCSSITNVSMTNVTKLFSKDMNWVFSIPRQHSLIAFGGRITLTNYTRATKRWKYMVL